MKPQVISQLVENVNEFISAYPNFSLSSVCQLADWNSSSYGRALKSRGLEPIKGGKSNPMAHIQELVEANDFDSARQFLEIVIGFRASCLKIMEADMLETPQVKAEAEVSRVETEEISQIEDFTHHLAEEMEAIENPQEVEPAELVSDYDNESELDENPIIDVDVEDDLDDDLDNLDE